MRLARQPSKQEILLEMSFRKALSEKEPTWSSWLIEQAYGRIPQRTTLDIETGDGEQRGIEAIAIKFSNQLEPVHSKVRIELPEPKEPEEKIIDAEFDGNNHNGEK